jgi:hypothetical protein
MRGTEKVALGSNVKSAALETDAHPLRMHRALMDRDHVFAQRFDGQMLDLEHGGSSPQTDFLTVT